MPPPVPPIVPAASSRRLRDLLGGLSDGPLRLVHAGGHAAYFSVPGPDGPWCLGVVAAGAVALPNALRVAAPDLAGLDVGAARLESGALHLGTSEVRVTRLVEVRVPARPVTPGPDTDATPLVERIGLGDGLTPYADDVLCGWLAIQRAAGRTTPDVDAEIRRSLHRTTLLSATLLDCAMHGEVLPPFAAYVSALGTSLVTEAEAALAAIGHSSGRGLLAGARLALGETAVAA